MSLYLDTSAAVSIFIKEARTPVVTKLVSRPGEAIVISDFTVGEFSAAVSTALRAGKQSELEALQVLADFDAWNPLRAEELLTTGIDISGAVALVRRFDLKLLFPDALHLALCERAEARLITGDKRQAHAATALHIPVTLV